MGLPKIRARLAEAKGLGCAQTQAWLTRSQGPHAFLDHFDCSFLGGQGELKNIEGLYHDWYRHVFLGVCGLHKGSAFGALRKWAGAQHECH